MVCIQGECVWRVAGGGAGLLRGCWELAAGDGASRLMFIPCWSMNWRRRWQLPGLMSNLADKTGCQATAVQQQAHCLRTKMLVPEMAFQYHKESLLFCWYLALQRCVFHPSIFQWSNQQSTYGDFGCKIIFKLAFSCGLPLRKMGGGDDKIYFPHTRTQEMLGFKMLIKCKRSVASLGWNISSVVFTLELNTPQGNSVVFSSYCVIYICFLYPGILPQSTWKSRHVHGFSPQRLWVYCIA